MEANEEDKILATALLSAGCGLKVKNRNKYRKRDEFEFLNG